MVAFESYFLQNSVAKFRQHVFKLRLATGAEIFNIHSKLPSNRVINIGSKNKAIVSKQPQIGSMSITVGNFAAFLNRLP